MLSLKGKTAGHSKERDRKFKSSNRYIGESSQIIRK
jgi:hypothetical protein